MELLERMNWSVCKFLLFSLIFVTQASGGSVKVSWDPNSESDLAGYNIYIGESSRNYTGVVDVGMATEFLWNNLDDGKTYYFTITAYDFAQNESGYSEEVSATLNGTGGGGNEDTNPPELVAVVINGETQVDVTYSEPVERASAEDNTNYSISNGIEIIGGVLSANQTTVHLITSVHERDRNYTLSVKNVKDLNDNVIATGTSKNYNLPNPSNDATPPELVYVVLVDETNLDVIFSEQVEKSSAENTSNYSINNSVQVLQAQLNSNRSVVRLTTTPHQAGQSYTLTVNNIRDLALTPNVIKQNSTFSYESQTPPDPNDNNNNGDARAPELVKVEVNGPTQIDISFSEPIEKTSAQDKSNYIIRPDIQIQGAILDPNLIKVHLITSSHKNGVEYSLSVSNIKDLAETPNEIAPNSTLTYSYTAEEPQNNSGNTGGQSPKTFALFQNYPNPFNPETEIRFYVEKQREVELKVYNSLGQLVRTLVKDEMPAGYHTVVWDGKNDDGRQLASGLYIYALEVKRNVVKGDLLVNVTLDRRVKRMTLVR